jgi:hypothetical protein
MGRNKSGRKCCHPQDGDEGKKVLTDPKSPNHVRAPKGLRDAVGRVVDLPWELEQDIEEVLPTGLEDILEKTGLAGKPVLVVLLAIGLVWGATKLSG